MRCEVIAAGVPDARLAVVDKAAHLAAVERPDEVAKILTGHLNQ